MKVFLVVPPSTGILSIPSSPHLGTAYLAGALRENRHNVKILDMRFGTAYSVLRSKLQKFKPDIVGITTTSMDHKKAYKAIRLMKQDGFRIMIGGPHASIDPEKIMEEVPADFAIKGEGEKVIIDLIDHIDTPQKVDGVTYRTKKGEIKKNKDAKPILDLDTIHFPAFDLFPLKRYMDKKIPLATSRGCPYQCTYCTIHFTMGYKFRVRTPKNVVDEIEHWYKKGYRYFSINDDCFSLNIKRAEEICDMIVARKLKLKFDLRNGIRINTITETLLRKMKRAGLTYVAFGVESADQVVLDKMKKGITAAQARTAILLADKVGVKKGAFFIIGMPGGTMKSFKKTLKFALSLPLDEVRFYNPIPFVGTELYTWVKENAKLLKPESYFMNKADYWDPEPIFETKDFNRKQRKEAFLMAEQHVMKYLMRKEFGRILGSLGWLAWRPRITRRIVFPIGKSIWSMVRRLRAS